MFCTTIVVSEWYAIYDEGAWNQHCKLLVMVFLGLVESHNMILWSDIDRAGGFVVMLWNECQIIHYNPSLCHSHVSSLPSHRAAVIHSDTAEFLGVGGCFKGSWALVTICPLHHNCISQQLLSPATNLSIRCKRMLNTSQHGLTETFMTLNSCSRCIFILWTSLKYSFWVDMQNTGLNGAAYIIIEQV